MSMLLGRLGFILLIVLPYVLAAMGMQQQKSLESSGAHRPRRLRLDMFLGPYYQHDLVDRIMVSNGMDDVSCQPLSTKRFGSFYINDPLVRITFYRSDDCTGAPAGTFYRSQENVLTMRARSVSVQKVRSMDIL